MSQGVYVLGGKCPEGICPWGKCPGVHVPGWLCPRTILNGSTAGRILYRKHRDETRREEV